MKVFTASVCALAAVTILVFMNSFLSAKLIDSVMEKIERIDTDTTQDELYEISDFYMKRQTYLALTVSHDDLSEIEDIIAELIGSGAVCDADGVIIAKSRLISALSHLRRLSGINLDSIL